MSRPSWYGPVVKISSSAPKSARQAMIRWVYLLSQVILLHGRWGNQQPKHHRETWVLVEEQLGEKLNVAATFEVTPEERVMDMIWCRGWPIVLSGTALYTISKIWHCDKLDWCHDIVENYLLLLRSKALDDQSIRLSPLPLTRNYDACRQAQQGEGCPVHHYGGRYVFSSHFTTITTMNVQIQVPLEPGELPLSTPSVTQISFLTRFMIAQIPLIRKRVLK